MIHDYDDPSSSINSSDHGQQLNHSDHHDLTTMIRVRGLMSSFCLLFGAPPLILQSTSLVALKCIADLHSHDHPHYLIGSFRFPDHGPT